MCVSVCVACVRKMFYNNCVLFAMSCKPFKIYKKISTLNAFDMMCENDCCVLDDILARLDCTHKKTRQKFDKDLFCLQHWVMKM